MSTALLSLGEARDAITVPRDFVDPELDERLTLQNDATGAWLDDVTSSALVGRLLVNLEENTELSNTVTASDPTDAQWSAVTRAARAGALVYIGTAVTHRSLLVTDRPDITLTGEPFVVPASSELWAGEFATEADVVSDLKLVAKHHLAWSWALVEGAPGDGNDFGAGVSFDVPRRIYNLLPGRYAPGVA